MIWCLTTFWASCKPYCFCIQIYFWIILYLLILTSIGVYYVISLFLVLSVLKTLNNLSIGFILILSSFTSCLLIPVWVHSESTSTYSHKFFLFNVLMFIYTFNFLSLLFFWFRITYQFWELLFIEVLYTMPTLNLHQNFPFYCSFHHLFFLEYYNSSSSVLIYSLW